MRLCIEIVGDGVVSVRVRVVAPARISPEATSRPHLASGHPAVDRGAAEEEIAERFDEATGPWEGR